MTKQLWIYDFVGSEWITEYIFGFSGFILTIGQCFSYFKLSFFHDKNTISLITLSVEHLILYSRDIGELISEFAQWSFSKLTEIGKWSEKLDFFIVLLTFNGA